MAVPIRKVIFSHEIPAQIIAGKILIDFSAITQAIQTADLPGVDKLIRRALDEDIQSGDLTTNNIVPENHIGKGYWAAKEKGVVAGLFIGRTVFRMLDEDIQWHAAVDEGEVVNPGDILVEIKGTSRALLTGERAALNFVQRLSGIATATQKYVDLLVGTGTQVLDTRKTVPGFRALDKYAVRAGGGTNHRTGLFDMVLIKENHIIIAGGIKPAVRKVKSKTTDVKIEVETTSFNEVEEAISAGADIIMLDNMSLEEMKEAVALIGDHTKTEASGNITLESVKAVADTGVDYISIGALTHSVQAFDISQLIET